MCRSFPRGLFCPSDKKPPSPLRGPSVLSKVADPGSSLSHPFFPSVMVNFNLPLRIPQPTFINLSSPLVRVFPHFFPSQPSRAPPTRSRFVHSFFLLRPRYSRARNFLPFPLERPQTPSSQGYVFPKGFPKVSFFFGPPSFSELAYLFVLPSLELQLF